MQENYTNYYQKNDKLPDPLKIQIIELMTRLVKKVLQPLKFITLPTVTNSNPYIISEQTYGCATLLYRSFIV